MSKFSQWHVELEVSEIDDVDAFEAVEVWDEVLLFASSDHTENDDADDEHEADVE